MSPCLALIESADHLQRVRLLG